MRGPNYLSRFSVFNENSCGNSVSIKQVKEKQETNIRYLLSEDSLPRKQGFKGRWDSRERRVRLNTD